MLMLSIMCFFICQSVAHSAVNCGNSLKNRVYANSAPAFPTERSQTQLMCRSGYVWNTGRTGEQGTNSKTATCNDIGDGYGSWITYGDCVGEFILNWFEILNRLFDVLIRANIINKYSKLNTKSIIIYKY